MPKSLKRRMARTRFACLLWGVFAATPARAQDSGELKADFVVDGAITAAALGAWVGSELGKEHLAPGSCRVCADNALDRAARDGLRWSRTGPAGTTSDIVVMGVAPAAALGVPLLLAAREDRLANFATDALIIAEAAALSADLNQLAKFLVGRERPFVHALPAAEKGETHRPADNNLSFYSGHTSLAFALAASSGTVATLRRYRGAPVVWTVGLTLGVAAGYLRMAADKHYLSDVATGALVGSAVGAGVPYLFHRAAHAERSQPVVLLLPARGGGVMSLTASW